MRRWLGLLLCVFSIFLPLARVSAEGGIGITPALEEVVLEEGQEKAEIEIGVTNSSNAEVQLRISTLDFGALNDSGGIAFLGKTGQETNRFGLSRWMSVDKEQIRLAPGQSEIVRMTVANSKDLSPGGHYGAVIVSAVNTDRPDGDAVAVQPAASTLVLLRKKGGESYGMELVYAKTNKSLINLAASSQLSFKNTGNVHAVVRGTVELMSPTGSVIKRGTINEQSSYVLPESQRNYEVKLNGSSPWLPGRYKLVTKWRYEGQQTFNEVVEHHWYIGKVTIVFVGLLCVVIVLIMYVRYRRRPPTRY